MKSILLYISLLINLLLLVAFLVALNRYGGWKNLWAKVNNRGIEHSYNHRKNLFELLPSNDSCIVFLGNSITAGGEWTELFPNKNILNRGIPGDHCDGVRERLDDIVRLHPSKLFLLIGVNDLCYHPPEVVLVKYDKLLMEISKIMPATTVYIQTLFPVNNSVNQLPVTNFEITELNTGIKQLADDYQMNLIDLFPILQDDEGSLDARYTSDGLHINGAAYLKWAQFLADKVNDEY